MAVKIGFPKGVVIPYSRSTIEKIMHMDAKNDCLSFCNTETHCYLLKHRDIPQLVHDGVIDIGVTSSEWVAESGLENISIQKHLDWCDTRISLIGSHAKNELVAGVKVVTEFPRITKQFLAGLSIPPSNIYKLSGSTEAMIPNAFLYGVECIETGQTLRANGLVEITEIMNASVVVITKKDEARNLSVYIDQIHNKGSECN
ncbi:ATP phosphoribosyltransferase [Pseudomonas sp. FEN]|uniref:ATP phosphoribosyltransferase n=1 Tax=Pseudomonas sp. FEN TaxID=2767468 RepID=UPI00174D9888|nr:ATP phosphoribosyltransferase [Pseudomonas sp. FEN]